MVEEPSQVTSGLHEKPVTEQHDIPWRTAGQKTLPALLGGIAFAPLVAASEYLGSVILIVLVFAVAISGFDMMFGWGNIYVFSPAAFALIGGVTSALLADTLGLPFLVAFFGAGIVSALAGLLIAGAVIIIGADFDIVVATLAFGELIILLLSNWEPVGPTGIFSVSGPSLGPVVLESQLAQYGFLLTILVLTIFSVSLFVTSRLGTLVMAMGENEELFRSIGYNPARYKFITILFGAFLLGIGGSLYAHVNGIITPGRFDVHQTLFFVVILLVGGLRSIYGPLVGAIVLTMLPEILRLFGVGNVRPYVVGGFLIVVVMLMPKGIVGRIEQGGVRPRSIMELINTWR